MRFQIRQHFAALAKQPREQQGKSRFLDFVKLYPFFMRTIRDRAKIKILKLWEISLPNKSCLSKPNLTKLALNKDQVHWRKMLTSNFSWKIEIKRFNLGKYVTLDKMWDWWCRYFKIYLFSLGLLSPVVWFVMCKEPKKRKLNKI